MAEEEPKLYSYKDRKKALRSGAVTRDTAAHDAKVAAANVAAAQGQGQGHAQVQGRHGQPAGSRTGRRAAAGGDESQKGPTTDMSTVSAEEEKSKQSFVGEDLIRKAKQVIGVNTIFISFNERVSLRTSGCRRAKATI